MTERKLSPEQIEELHEFCYFQSVIHYDTQVELVDHLASAIEEIWETKPSMSFEKALEQVNQQFGGHAGFFSIRQEKEKVLRKKYQRLLWQFVADYYKLPKIMITLVLFLGIYTALRFTENDQWITGSLSVLFIVFSLGYFLYYFPKYVKIKVPEKHSFLFNEITQNGVISKTLSFSGGFVGMISHATHFTTLWSIVFSFLISFFLVLLYGDCFFIPIKIREHFSQQFPQFILS